MENIKIFEETEQRAKSGTWLYDLKDQFKDYVYDLSKKAFAEGDAARDALSDKAGLEARQERARQAFLDAVGGLPEPSADLAAEIVGVLHFDGYRVEKIIYQPREKVYATANIYIPDGLSGRTGTVIFVCGHHTNAKHEPEYQIVCQYLVRAGLVVFAQDPIGQGERFSYIDKETGELLVTPCVEEHDYAGFQCSALGRGIARYFVYDIMRAVDYLSTRPEVDIGKIGITGNSGGGTQSSMAMLAERRLAAAAPATFVMNREYYMKTGQAQDREQIWDAFTALGLDHEDIILSMAPKPVLILGVVHDFFPIEATEKTYLRCRRIWDTCQKGENLERFYDDCDHHYTRKMAKKAAGFFAAHLLGKKLDWDNFDDALVEAIDPASLHCTPTGQVVTSIGDARVVFDVNNLELDILLEKRSLENEAQRKARLEEAAKFLRGRVYKNRRAAPGHFLKRWMGEISEGGLYAEGYLWMSQEDIVNGAVVFRSGQNATKKLPVTLAVWQGGSCNVCAHAGFIASACGAGRAVWVLDMTGNGLAGQRPLSSHQSDPYANYGAMYKLNDDLLWLDDSTAALRTYDILRLLDVIENNADKYDVGDLEIYTSGRYSVYADLAKFLDGRIKKVASDESLSSYAELIRTKFYDTKDVAGVILPGLMNYADLGELRNN